VKGTRGPKTTFDALNSGLAHIRMRVRGRMIALVLTLACFMASATCVAAFGKTVFHTALWRLHVCNLLDQVSFILLSCKNDCIMPSGLMSLNICAYIKMCLGTRGRIHAPPQKAFPALDPSST
jgi:hypothetical protein